MPRRMPGRPSRPAVDRRQLMEGALKLVEESGLEARRPASVLRHDEGGGGEPSRGLRPLVCDGAGSAEALAGCPSGCAQRARRPGAWVRARGPKVSLHRLRKELELLVEGIVGA